MPDSFQSKLIVLSGKTGCGKSSVLRFLSRQYPVIDLEEIAAHRGSAFGNVGIDKPQPSQQLFERQLLQIRDEYKSRAFIFMEQKPSSIGKRKIPALFYKKMQEGLLVQLNVSKNLRVKNIIKEYFNTERKQQDILTALHKLSERFSREKISFFQELILKGDYTTFVTQILEYYDHSSKYQNDKKPFIEIFVQDERDAENISQEIIQSLNKKGIILS